MKKCFAILGCFLLIISLFGCALFTPATSSAVVEDWPVSVNGVEVTARPSRVVSFSPGLTEILFALDLGGILAGCSDYCDYPEETNLLTKVGTATLPNSEALIAAAPDYVLTQTALPTQTVQLLEGQGAKILLISPAYDFPSVAEIYRLLFVFAKGGQEGLAQGEAYAEWFLAEVEAITQGVPATAPTAAYLVGVPGLAATGDTLEHHVLDSLGLSNVAVDGQNWIFSDEQLVAANPGILLVAEEMDLDGFSAEETHSQMIALVGKKIFPVHAIVFERQSPRMLREMDILAQAIYGSDYEKKAASSSSALSSEDEG